MKALLARWTIARILRLILGTGILVQGITNHDIMFAIAGGIFALVAITNTGCCGSNGCSTDLKKHDPFKNEIIYEEVDTTK
jgi:hypothetical protein